MLPSCIELTDHGDPSIAPDPPQIPSASPTADSRKRARTQDDTGEGLASSSIVEDLFAQLSRLSIDSENIRNESIRVRDERDATIRKHVVTIDKLVATNAERDVTIIEQAEQIRQLQEALDAARQG